jgi:hypothetical protein
MPIQPFLLATAALVWLGGLVALLAYLFANPRRSGRRASRRIRIIATPPGEAPPEVRAAWVGCVLPLFGRTGDRRISGKVRGVLSRKRAAPFEGYAVRVLDALRALGRWDPQAARWWREHAPHLMNRRQLFLFPEETCKLLDAEDETEGPAGREGE